MAHQASIIAMKQHIVGDNGYRKKRNRRHNGHAKISGWRLAGMEAKNGVKWRHQP